MVPERLLRLYHQSVVLLAAARYGFPSRKLIVIGVTGTNGKSTTVEFIRRLLTHGGFIVGSTSTVDFHVAGQSWMNALKMTMLGRFALQKLLRRMVDAGCQYAVIEASSEGLAQGRALGIAWDIAVFTNLTPEHIESHGSFTAYREAKELLFRAVAERRPKRLNRTHVPRVTVINADDTAGSSFARYQADRRFVFTTKAAVARDRETVSATSINSDASQAWQIAGVPFRLPILGRHNISNALAAIAVGLSQGLVLQNMAEAVATFTTVPGRLELIDEGQPFTVVVDYAPEPASLLKAFETVEALHPKRIIHVTGSTGGGRDKARRPVLGRISAEHASITIVTNEDPYDDDPQTIIDEVAAGARDPLCILDRREAIARALQLAREGDVVLITGKGAEQVMAVAGGKKIPWDDRQAVREALLPFSLFSAEKRPFPSQKLTSRHFP